MKYYLPLLFICFLLNDLTAQSPARAGKDYVLIFVVTDFDYWPDLPGIDKPLRTLATELETNYGFQNSDFRLNPTKTQIMDALSTYQKRTYGSQDQLLIFFSMHGQYDEAIGALIPRDGRLDDPTYESWITHPALEAMLSKIPCAHQLLALDACYSGTFGTKYKDKPQRAAFEDRPTDCAGKIREALEKTSRLYLTSGGKERTPSNSQFLAKWLEALQKRNTDGLLSFAELYAVLLEARPQPMYGDFRGHVFGGDFVLARRDLCVVKPVDPMEADKFDWRAAKAKNTIDAYFDYVTQHPQGLYVDEARDAIKRLTGAPAVSEMKSVVPASTSLNLSGNLLLIKGGSFTMGDLFGDSNEYQHSVTVDNFYLGKTEVTFNDYDAFCNATGHEKPSDYDWGRGQRPVINVSWYDAVEYCNWLSVQHNRNPAYTIDKDRQDPNNANEKDTKKWLVRRVSGANGYRLPTEAEWEYAARENGKKIRFGNGKNQADPAEINFDPSGIYKQAYSVLGRYYQKTVEVGSMRSPNHLGLHDMSGNVFEWCEDWYGNYVQEAQINPTGATEGEERVLRGGSWFYGPIFCRVANRYTYPPAYSREMIGFRIAASF